MKTDVVISFQKVCCEGWVNMPFSIFVQYAFFLSLYKSNL